MVNIQFSDETESEIVAYFASPQDADDYPNQGTVEFSDPRWKEFYDRFGGELSLLPHPDD